MSSTAAPAAMVTTSVIPTIQNKFTLRNRHQEPDSRGTRGAGRALLLPAPPRRSGRNRRGPRRASPGFPFWDAGLTGGVVALLKPSDLSPTTSDLLRGMPRDGPDRSL